MQNDDAIQHRQRETYTVYSLFTLASFVLTPAQKLKLRKNLSNTIRVDVRFCCTLLSELIKSNDQPQIFDPLGDRRHMFEKHRQSRLTCYNVTHTALQIRHINCLKIAHELGFPLHMTDDELGVNIRNCWDIECSIIPWKRGIPSKAAYYGNLTCLKYAHQQGIPWDISTCTAATLGEKYDCLKYAVENGCPLNESGPINQALGKGNLLFLKYLHEQGCPWSAVTSKYAIWGRNLKCLEYIHANGCPWSESTCYEAVISQNFECLKFVVENGCPLTENAINQAAVDNLLFLKYLHERGCPWSVETFARAASTGDLDCLKYLQANGCPWDVSTCTNAVKNQHFSCLEFVVNNGCPLNSPQPALEAASIGNLTILKYLHERGCPWIIETCTLAALRGDIEYLKHARAKGCPWNTRTLGTPLIYMYKVCSKLMKRIKCKWDNSICSMAIGKYKQPECIEYLWRNGCPLRIGTCSAGSGDGRMDCLLFEPDHNCKWDHEKFNGYAAVLRKTREITSAHITALLVNSILEVLVAE
ncbi:hypothetical protein QTP88_017181 [Uroleucon formosanum]